MGQIPGPMFGVVSYLVLACVGGVLGYYFARKRTEYEIGYQHRVEIVERVQRLLLSIAEEFEVALGYVREPGPSRKLPVESVGRAVDELDKYRAQQEIWLDAETSARLEDFVSGLRVRQRMLEHLPQSYVDAGFEQEYGRAAEDLESWLEAGFPQAHKELEDSFRQMLGIGSRRLRRKVA